MESSLVNHQMIINQILKTMINFTQNLYTTQWLDLVFQNRNQRYGAYELRKHNSETTAKAFVYACVLFCSIIIFPWIYNQMVKTAPVSDTTALSDPVEVDLIKINPAKPLPPASAKPVSAAPRLRTVQYTHMVVVPATEETIEPPSQTDIVEAIAGTTNSSGDIATGTNDEVSTATTGNGVVETVGNLDEVHSLSSIQSYPEFPGGNEAFAKYLSRNLRYPLMASENGIQGRVMVSFIIERNGDLSDIRIIRGIGGGCDKEAIRVLAKSPAWKPGIQNNQNVRVAYTLPINFRLP